MARLAPVDCCPQPAIPAPSVSAGSLAGLLSGRRCDPRAFQRVYPDKWAAFLKAHFISTVQVAAFFDVDEKTARQWWNGTTGPRGWCVSYAVISIPSAAVWLVEAA